MMLCKEVITASLSFQFMLCSCNLLVDSSPKSRDALAENVEDPVIDPFNDNVDSNDVREEKEDVIDAEFEDAEIESMIPDSMDIIEQPEDVDTEEISEEAHDTNDLEVADEYSDDETEPVCGNGSVETGEECDPPDSTRNCTTICGSTGTQTCNSSCEWSGCIPPDEICNGIDDDCVDGPDNGFDCIQGEAVSCTTTCGSTGTGTCGSDCSIPSSADCTPPFETCNGADDDCDTICDNGFDCCQGTTGEACVNPVGLDGTRDCDLSCNWTECCAPVEVCWNDYDDDCDGNVDETGKLGADIEITDSSNHCLYPSLVYTGSEYGLSWGNWTDSEIYFVRLNEFGTKVGGNVKVTDASGISHSTSLVFTGSEFALSWVDDRDTNPEIYFARISATGTKIGGDVRMTDATGNSEYPSLVFTGSEYGVSWQDDRDGNSKIYFARLNSTGTKVGSNVGITSEAGWSPTLVYTGSEYGLSWDDGRGVEREIYFVRISDLGAKIGTDVRITNTSAWSGYPSLVYTGSEYGLVWEDQRDGDSRLYFVRVSSIGVKTGIEVAITDSSSFSRVPDLVFTGTEYGVSWYSHGGRDIYFARISTSGTKNGSDVLISDGTGEASWYNSLVFTGNEFGISWSDDRIVRDMDQIYFARIGCLP